MPEQPISPPASEPTMDEAFISRQYTPERYLDLSAPEQERAIEHIRQKMTRDFIEWGSQFRDAPSAATTSKIGQRLGRFIMAIQQVTDPDTFRPPLLKDIRQQLNDIAPHMGDTCLSGALAESTVANLFWQNMDEDKGESVELAPPEEDLMGGVDLIVHLKDHNQFTKYATDLITQVKVHQVTDPTELPNEDETAGQPPDNAAAQTFFPLTGPTALNDLRQTLINEYAPKPPKDGIQRDDLDREIDTELAIMKMHGRPPTEHARRPEESPESF